jgi:hypothetical protein
VIILLFFSFAVADQFELFRASLIHCMELKVDGETQTHEFVCPLEDTMAICGIKAGSKLFVNNRAVEEGESDYLSE